jgi:anti-anti-sigma factor
VSDEAVNVMVETRGDATVVRVQGVVDGATLPEVSRALTEAQRDNLPVIVDLAGVDFMDSRGLGALLAANERTHDGAAPISIHNPSEAVRRLLELSGVGPVLRETAELPPG